MRGRTWERERQRAPAAIFLPCNLKSPEEDRRWIWKNLLPLSLTLFSWMLFSPFCFYSFSFIVSSPVHFFSPLFACFLHFISHLFPYYTPFFCTFWPSPLLFCHPHFASFIFSSFSSFLSELFCLSLIFHFPLPSSPNPSLSCVKPLTSTTILHFGFDSASLRRISLTSFSADTNHPLLLLIISLSAAHYLVIYWWAVLLLLSCGYGFLSAYVWVRESTAIPRELCPSHKIN